MHSVREMRACRLTLDGIARGSSETVEPIAQNDRDSLWTNVESRETVEPIARKSNVIALILQNGISNDLRAN